VGKDEVSDLGWHVISGEDLLVMLRRVETGERPSDVFAEYWANATVHESYREADDESK
jgi:predicted HTH transcriptional regulator